MKRASLRRICACGVLLAGGLRARANAPALDYAAGIGAGVTSARAEGAGALVQAKPNLEFGLTMAYRLRPRWRVFTGSWYEERHVDLGLAAGPTHAYDFAYVDVPLGARFDFVPSFGVFAGVVGAINVNQSVRVGRGEPAVEPPARAVIFLSELGIDFAFADRYGIEVYAERGFGAYVPGLTDFRTYGARFNYWF